VTGCRRPNNFSRKRPVTAQLSLVPTAANTARRRRTGTRARESARNSYIRDHEHPPGGRAHSRDTNRSRRHRPPRTAVFRSRGDRLASPTHDGQPPRAVPITQTAKPVARSPTGSGRRRSIPLNYWAGAGRLVPGTRTRVTRHHQQHGPGAPDQLERHETLDPVCSDAVKARIQCARQASGSGPIFMINSSQGRAGK
jgi:hypothetical protein